MIAIVSSNARECSAFAAVCDSRGWPAMCCSSLRAFRTTLPVMQPKVVITRHKLDDGYSDDVLSALKASAGAAVTRTIVLMPAGVRSSQHARQVALGADCVLHDPVGTDVLVEYLARYRARSATTSGPTRRAAPPLPFAGATVDVLDRTLRHAQHAIVLTPRELQLVRVLAEAPNQVVSYDTLYSEILGRRFSGDSANMRVLLGRLDASLRRVKIRLRHHVEVIAKSGYRYRDTSTAPLRLTRASGRRATQAA